MKSARFGSPVSGSWKTWCARRSCANLFSLMSANDATTADGFVSPASMIGRVLIEIQTREPSARATPRTMPERGTPV